MRKVQDNRHGYGPLFSLLVGVGAIGWAPTAMGRTKPERETQPRLRIMVRVHDYAGVTGGTLERAERETARIFQEVGIEVRWVACPLRPSELPSYPACAEAATSPRFDMNVVPRSMATRTSMPETTLGFVSLVKDGQRAFVASVFLDRVKQEAERTGESLPQILGHAMAHELGHLLLRTSGHSSVGIMRARWTADDFHRAESGQLLFTSQQAELMRIEVRARAQQPARAEPASK